MEHYYLNTSFGPDDFFTSHYKNVYADFAKILSDGDLFVEIGSWTGRSASFLAIEILNNNKQVQIDCIDPWPDIVPPFRGKTNRYENGMLYQTFINNINPVKHIINPIRLLSAEAVNLYKDESIDILFIDGDHRYDAVKSDILNFLPKIKNGGIIAGHDYSVNSWPGVVQAVNEIFGRDIVIKHGCWIKQL